MSSDPAADLDRLLAARIPGKPLPKNADRELRKLVDLAEFLIISLEEVPPPPGGLAAGRQALVVEAAARARTNWRPRPVPRPGWRRVFAWGIIATLLFVVLTLGSSVSASNSLPGDALYPVKRVSERVLLLMDNSPTVREELDSRRQREALELLHLGRSARVRFSGTLLETHPNYWVIAGRETDFTVLLGEETDIIGRPEIGNRVRVEAETRRGDLIALLLQVEPRPRVPGPAPASPTPPPPATDPAAAPVRPGTAPGRTIPVTPTATATPTPSATATVAPPQPAPPEDDAEPRRSNSQRATTTRVPSATPATGVTKVPPPPAAGATASPTETRTHPSPTPSPTDTPAPTVEPTATPRNETVPRATPSPTPAAHTP